MQTGLHLDCKGGEDLPVLRCSVRYRTLAASVLTSLVVPFLAASFVSTDEIDGDCTWPSPTRGNPSISGPFENDVSKILQRIEAADQALSDRQRELGGGPYRFEVDAELRAMLVAADALLKLKAEKLGWPTVSATQPKHREKSDSSSPVDSQRTE